MAPAAAPQLSMRQTLAITAFRKLWLADHGIGAHQPVERHDLRQGDRARDVARDHGAAGMPAIHEDAGHRSHQGQGQEEEDGDHGDGPRGGVHAKGHFAEDGVERQEIAEDADQGQQTVQIVQMGSPVLAGALAGWAGPSSCYYLDSASFVFSGLVIASIAIPARPAHANREVKPVVRDLLSGVRFIFGHPVIGFVILSIAAGTFAIGAFGSLLAVYVRDVLHANTYLFGALGSTIGAGMLAGGLAVTPLARRIQQKAHLITAGFCGASIGAIARLANTVAALAGCFGIGIGASLLTIAAMALMQGQVPAEMRGRVSSSSMSLISISQGVALVFAGDLASRFGIAAVFYGSAVLLLLIAIAGTYRLRRIERSTN